MRYGTPPVVRSTGGLADTVQEFDPLTGEGTGFLFQRFEAGEMIAALRRALAVRKQPELWQRIRRNGMAKDFSWRASAQAYDRVYSEARNRVAAGRARTLERVRKVT
jgi:starch synthase